MKISNTGRIRWAAMAWLPLMLGTGEPVSARDMLALAPVPAGVGQEAGPQAGHAGGEDQPDPATWPAQRLQAIARQLLDASYGAGNFDADRRCWWHEWAEAGEPVRYCMRAAPPQLVRAGQQWQLHVLAYSDPQAELYSLDQPGLKGLFAAQLEVDGQWQLLAASAGSDVGQAGDCGCADARLVQVGPARHGWLSVAGGNWQGTAVAHYLLEVPLQGRFRNVSRVPRNVEGDDPLAFNQLEIGREPAVAGMYPLQVSRRHGEAVLETRQLLFDPAAGFYPWTP